MKRFRLSVSSALLLFTFAPVSALAQPNPVGSGTVTSSRARFVVQAVKFMAMDETGVDWLGSDEIILRYTVDNYDVFTSEYGDVDWGERHDIRPQQRCIAPAVETDGQTNQAWSCQWEGRAAPITMTISIYEFDGLIRDLLTHPPIHGFCAGGGGDLLRGCDPQLDESNIIGKYRLTLTEAALTAALPHPGMWITRKLRVDGCSAMVTIENGFCAGSSWWNGAYDVTIQINRVRNAPFNDVVER